MDQLETILQSAAGAAALAAGEALGATKETKGEDVSEKENRDKWGPVLMVGGALLVLITLGFILMRKR